jgi:hypothetical protein
VFFRGRKIEFRDLSIRSENEYENLIYLDFKDCKFNNEVRFYESYFQNITFINCEILELIKITDCNVNKIILDKINIDLKLNENENKTLIILDHNILNIRLKLIDVKNINEVRLTKLEVLGKLKFQNCQLGKIELTFSKFKNDFEFLDVNLLSESKFLNNIFNKTDYNNTDFGLSAKFKNNDFEGTTLFENTKNLDKTSLTFKSCKFIKYAYFNNSKIKHLSFDTTKFIEFSSFQDTVFETINIDRTVFDSPAFFDDIEIIKFSKCNKRTLRNIKQQLLRADNKIDYNNFRAHELNSYREELKKNIKLNPKANRKKLRRDLSILRINSFYSNNGADWVKAFKRTLFVSFLFYSIFYIIHNFDRQIDLGRASGYSEYFIGLFRYFLLTDFHNPLVNTREYLTNMLEWIPFILGKIFIGIGIYEILISFRKFKR